MLVNRLQVCSQHKLEANLHNGYKVMASDYFTGSMTVLTQLKPNTLQDKNYAGTRDSQHVSPHVQAFSHLSNYNKDTNTERTAQASDGSGSGIQAQVSMFRDKPMRETKRH